MTQIFTALWASLDGFIAGPDDRPGQPLGKGGTRLFDWYSDGDTPSRYYESFKLSASSAEVFDAMAGRVGAVISGRRTYDISNAWGGTGPLPGAPLFVLTHRVPQSVPPGEPAYTFVTDGIVSAVAQARTAAGGKDVSLMGSAAVQQCLRAGLLDEIEIHLIPVLLGGGVRLLDHIGENAVQLERCLRSSPIRVADSRRCRTGIVWFSRLPLPIHSLPRPSSAVAAAAWAGRR
jgi:dihydrofolate reductase